MARLVQRQNSDAFSDRNHLGCMGFFLQYLDERHLLHSKTLLEESKTGDSKQPATTKCSRLHIPLKSNQHDKSHGEANLKPWQVPKKNSGKALRDLITKKMFGKLQRKQKMLPVTPHLLRTFSIHHLECNDYVIPEEITENEESLESLETDPSRTSKQVSYLEEGIKSEACRSLDTVKSSFRRTSSTLAECDLDGVLPDASIEIDMHTSEPVVINSYCPNNQMHQRTHLNHLKNVIRDNRKEILRISMDSLLHKVPYGQKMPKDISRKNLFRSISAGSSRDVSSDKIGILPPYRRSHSLSESLDQYTDLLNSISIRESNKNLEPLISIKKYNSLQEKQTPRRFERIHSDPEFRPFRSRLDSQRHFHASLSLKELSITLLDVDKCVDGSVKPDLSETSPYVKDKMESDKCIMQNQIMNSRDRTDKSLLVEDDESELKINEFQLSETCKATNSKEQHGVYTKKDNGDLDCSFLESQSDQIELTESSDTKQKGNDFIALHPSDEPTKKNQVFDLDSHLEEGIVSPSTSKDCGHGNLQFEECDSFPKPVNSFDVDVSSGTQIVESSSTGKQPESSSDAFCIKLDQKDEAEFNYVRDVLMESGFDSSEFVGAWYSHFKGLDHFLFDKGNRIFDELETAPHNSGDTSFDHQVLSDLINEVLLEIYEKCFVHDWFLRVLPNVRPIPVGDHLLMEVWMKISWLLSYQRQLIHTCEGIMTRDFAKSDGWLNLQWDAEYVGMELESLIMDDLLDEFMPEIIDC